MQYGFYFDQSRCIGCNACVVSCKQWHLLPPGPGKWIRVYQWESGFVGNIQLHFLAIPCYHCTNPVCAKACPNGAIYKEEQFGAVLINPQKCQGKKRCWAACPYGAISFRPEGFGGRASKCTMCIDRLQEGKKPICVLSCSMRALEFGLFEELQNTFGKLRELLEMPSGNLTQPSVVFKQRHPKRQILPWDMEKALRLWKRRGPHDAFQNSSDLFGSLEDLKEIPPNTIGRDRLVLKTQKREEFMYYTTDND
jgi:anaerobic dimethyl sulfoxide reductase subunit B